MLFRRGDPAAPRRARGSPSSAPAAAPATAATSPASSAATSPPAGVRVVSGLALGIDGAAHAGALDAPARRAARSASSAAGSTSSTPAATPRCGTAWPRPACVLTEAPLGAAPERVALPGPQPDHRRPGRRGRRGRVAERGRLACTRSTRPLEPRPPGAWPCPGRSAARRLGRHQRAARRRRRRRPATPPTCSSPSACRPSTGRGRGRPRPPDRRPSRRRRRRARRARLGAGHPRPARSRAPACALGPLAPVAVASARARAAPAGSAGDGRRGWRATPCAGGAASPVAACTCGAGTVARVAWQLEAFAASLTVGVRRHGRGLPVATSTPSSPGPSGLGLDRPGRGRPPRRCAATSPTWPPAATPAARIARKASPLRRYFGWLRRTGAIADRPVASACRRPRATAACPQVLRPDELDAAARRARPAAAPATTRRRPSPRATTPCSSCSTAAACGWPSCAASARPTSTSTRGRVTVWGKGAKQRRGADQRARRSPPCGRGSPTGRPSSAPADVTRPTRLFLNRRGRPLTPRDVRRILDRRAAGADPPPRPAPHLRHPPARRRRRPAGRAGAARPRRPRHHADLHPRQPGAAAARSFDDHPPPRLTASRSPRALRPVRRDVPRLGCRSDAAIAWSWSPPGPASPAGAAYADYVPPVDAPVVDPFRPPPAPYAARATGASSTPPRPGTPGRGPRAPGSVDLRRAGRRRRSTSPSPTPTASAPATRSWPRIAVIAGPDGVRSASPVGRRPAPRLHVGARRGDTYIDPASLWGRRPAPGARSCRSTAAPAAPPGPRPTAGPARLAGERGERLRLRSARRPAHVRRLGARTTTLHPGPPPVAARRRRIRVSSNRRERSAA